MTHNNEPLWGTTGIELADGVDRPLAADEFSVPIDLRLENETLVWSWLKGAHQVHSGPGLLDQFVQLSDVSDERILAYARRWGLLILCEQHHLPIGHNQPLRFAAPMSAAGASCNLQRRASDYSYLEATEDWRHFARQARALISIAARLHGRQLGAAADWALVYERTGREGPPGQGILEAERFALTLVVNEWLVLGSVRPQFHWDSGRTTMPAITLGGGGLFGALAVQLMLAVSMTDGLALCSACGAPFVPTRRPRPDERHYCPTCREAGRPQRDAARDHRRRNAQPKAASPRSIDAPRARKQK